jgi:hypothetical protein
MKKEIYSPFEPVEGLAEIPAKAVIGGKIVKQLRQEYIANPWKNKFTTERVRNAKGQLLFEVTALYNGVIPIFLGNAKMVLGGWKWHNYTQIKQKA